MMVIDATNKKLIGRVKKWYRKTIVNSMFRDRELDDPKTELKDWTTAQTRELAEKNIRLQEMNEEITEAIGDLVEDRNLESGTHVKRVKKITRIIAETAQYVCPQYHISDEDVTRISDASALHDVGKIKIRDSILLKPGKYTKEEFEEMKTHTVLGSEMLDHFSNIWGEEYGTIVRNVCLYHHERWDGKGYPYGLKGDEIPAESQIVALADVYDALTNERTYKKAFSHEEACKMIVGGECGAFSPDMLACFIKCKDRILQMKHELQAEEKSDNIKHLLFSRMSDDDLRLVAGGITNLLKSSNNPES